MSSPILVIMFSLLLGYTASFALINGFNISINEATVVFFGTVLASFFAARSGWHVYWGFALALIGTFVSLGSTFSGAHPSDSPFQTGLVLPGMAIYVLAFAVATMVMITLRRIGASEHFAKLMLVSFTLNWLILAVNTMFYEDWKLENYLTVPFVVLLALCFKAFRLSNLSYALIYVYMMFHIVGSHFTYSEVPFGVWLGDAMGMARNHYDRIVHFSFGLLLAYPIREMTIRISRARGVWGLYMPVEFVLAFSAIYEILEWLIAITYGGDLGVAYLGTQGDEWDAIKDMALAGLGAFIAMSVVALYHLGIRPAAFLRELRKSLEVKEKTALGEVYVEKTSRKRR